MRLACITLRKEPYYRKAAVVDGLKRLGYAISDKVTHPTGKDSLLLAWNRKAGSDDQQATLWEQRNGTVIVMENAYLQRTDKTMYAISAHGHNGSGWFPVGDEDRFSRLGFPLKPWRADSFKGYELVCGQRSIGSPAMRSPPQWGEKWAAKLKAKGLPVRFRPHPGNFAPKVPLLTDLVGATACHIWSSSAGVMALVEGVPVYHHAPHWICEGWKHVGREKALHRMAWGQWSVAEIETGEPFARILADKRLKC